MIDQHKSTPSNTHILTEEQRTECNWTLELSCGVCVCVCVCVLCVCMFSLISNIHLYALEHDANSLYNPRIFYTLDSEK